MGRSPCCEQTHTNKGAWTKEEDQRLVNYIRLHGEGSWRSLPASAGLLRCGKSCRLRWINYLRPDLKRGNFSEDEDELIIKLHSVLGNKWSLIAARLPGRTDNEIKNYWNTHIKRKLISRGLDPQTHHRSFNSTTAAATPTANAIATTSLDFRKNTSTVPSKILPSQNLISLPNNNLNSLYKFKTESVEEGNCSSSTTEETQQQYYYHKQHEKPVLDLELSIGLPVIRTDQKIESIWHDSRMAKPPTLAAPRMCLCWQLGFQNKAGEFCSNCRSSTAAFYSYC